ncbi:HAD family hydrolase [Ilyobacter polytropus]|uniref:HAD-superfamily hydrolase, subfamily IA, variant 1 n=1 Tax=Ilyobacter polytropus (strain ATCC 51220 / DSM 2926 / LMG 16218 / CuHBu1) TaxID=572544 RepID=E3HCW5_ILYPC|nr:HAD family hydrolase [Ilyobacter polytropus]ADO84021.1 HAD-superfamily hydrolase, subfamily IA, variant 1 [Ilyobacter polytropus DSM 2926]
MIKNIKIIIFDWGDTLMRDYNDSGPMAHWKNVDIIPGVREVLRELGKNYTLCVASNAGESDSGLMKSALKRVGIDNFFSYFFTSKDLGFEKPDIRFFKAILKSTNFSANECLMVGNDYNNDIVNSKSLGMSTLLFDENNLFSDTLSADYKINKIIQILDILKP